MNLENRKLGYIEGVLSAVLNTVLFGFKLWVGMKAGSVAMVADAWHTMSDTLTSLVVILGFWISSKPGDEEHPFGHGRAELIAAVVIGTLLGIVGVNFLKDSYVQLHDHKTVTFGPAAVIVFSISVVLKEAIARFSLWAGKKTRSQSLVADGWHHRSDALASALVLVGALLGKRFWWVDGALGFGVSLLILYAAFGILKNAANALMGERADERIVGDIQALMAESSPMASDVHHIHVHRYGDHVEVTLHARMPAELSLGQAHGVCSKFEAKIRERLGYEATIHLEPMKARPDSPLVPAAVRSSGAGLGRGARG